MDALQRKQGTTHKAAAGRSATKRRPRGRPRLTDTQRIWNAVARGAQDGPAIARQARVPLLHVQPTLSRLRRQGRIKGYAGNLQAIHAGESR